MAYIAVQGCTLMLGSGITAAPLQITEPTSQTIKINDMGIYAGASFTVMVTGYMGGQITNSDGIGTATISPSMIVGCKADNMPILAEGDMSAPFTINGTMPGPNGPVPAVATDIITVQMAGQKMVDAT